MNSIAEVANFLKESDCIEIFTHTNPDGDAIGSSSALAYALKKLGKRVCVTVADAVPKDFDYIYENISSYSKFESQITLTVDVASRTLLKNFPECKKIDLAIDHHLNNTVGAERIFCDPHSSACGEIIFELIDALGVEIDLYIAECLYTAIATDTGCFKFSNTSSKTFEIASKLCNYTENGNFGYINTRLFITKSPKKIALETEILQNLEYYFSGKVVIACLTDEILHRVGIEEKDACGVEQLAKIPEGVLIGVTLKERQNGFKVSMRSEENYDVAKICADFGGGGHRCAAGCFIEGSKSEVINKLLCYMEGENIV